ncbi:hypothetical protein MAR_028246, partial [Mya arenaria]
MEPGIQRIGLGLIEPSERFQVLGNGFVARSLVYAQEIVPVRLANFSKETQTYYPGTNVATISKVDRVEEKSTKLKYGDTLPEHMEDMYDRASEGMTDGNKLKIMDLLKKYSHIFSKDDHDLGRTEQCKDSDLTEVRNWVQDGKKPWLKNIGSASYQVKSLWNQFEMLEIHDKLLVRKWDDKSTGQILHQERLETAHNTVRQATGQAMKRQKQIRDKRNSYEHFDIGDKVLVYFPVRKPGTSSKFTSFWRGPYAILGKLSDVLYKVDCGRKKAEQVIHCDRIRKCKSQILLGE